VTIVGGGATGVELAAELHASARVLSNFGFENIHPEKDLQIVLVEAAPRLLSQLPERLSEAALRELRKLAIEVHTNEKVVEVTADAVKMASGMVISSTITVWAAGIKAADFLAQLGGDDRGGLPPLETNRLNQLVVNGRLQTTRDPDIYAFGDCAACPQPGGKWVPPRAQSAYQQAMYLVRSLTHIVRDGSADPDAAPYIYLDRGSLVSLAEYSSVGSLMGSLTRGSLFVEGHLAKMMYWGLHKQHQIALGGFLKTVLITLSELLDRTHRPRIKLY
jgi:NADH dehydrogenase